MKLRGGFSVLQAQQELFEAGARAFRFNENALAGIVDPPGQAEFRREAMHKRAGNRPLAPRRARQFSSALLAAHSSKSSRWSLSPNPPFCNGY